MIKIEINGVDMASVKAQLKEVAALLKSPPPVAAVPAPPPVAAVPAPPPVAAVPAPPIHSIVQTTGDPAVVFGGEEKPELDAEGQPWDERIHSAGRTRIKKTNVWKLQRSVDAGYVKKIQEENGGEYGSLMQWYGKKVAIFPSFVTHLVGILGSVGLEKMPDLLESPDRIGHVKMELEKAWTSVMTEMGAV